MQNNPSELTIAQIHTLWDGTVSSHENPELSIKPDTKKVIQSSRLQNIIRVMRVGEAEETGTENNPNDLDLVDFIGSGGMGVVFRANQKSIDRNVAVKIIKPEIAAEEGTRENFIREAMVTGNLEHPNIVPIHELGALEDGTLFYSMKEVKGTPWKQVIRNKTYSENLDILQKVCDAVAFAHGKGIIHRDLKPENVMLGEYGEVMVMDWGLAVNVNRDAQSANAEILDEESGHAGTPAYMAPEMASCDYRNIGKRSDIYLLGAILYEIVGGVKPHAGKDVLECLHNAARNIIRPCSADGELMNIARKAMSTKPEDRYPGVKDFQNAIRDYQKHSESIALQESAVEHLVKAQSASDYELYAQSVFGFKEALKLWPDNINAKLKLAEANQEYAKCAYSKNDLDLAMSLLNSANSGHMDLLNKVNIAYKDRDRKKKLLRRLTYGSAGLAAGIILILLVSVLWIQAERSSAIKARDIAVNAEQKIKAERDKAEEALVKMKVAQESELAAKQETGKIANTSLKYGYKSTLLAAKEKIDKSQFADAVETLKSAPAVKRNIEWGLIKNMSLAGSMAKEFDGKFCAISSDETKVALLADKGKSLRICNISGEEICRFDIDGNDKTPCKINFPTKFSPDSKYLLKDNTIFELNAKKAMRKLPNLDKYSPGTYFLFSYDSKFLIACCYEKNILENTSKEKNNTSNSSKTTVWIEVFELPTLKPVWSSIRTASSSYNPIKLSASENIVAIGRNLEENTLNANKVNTDIIDLRNGKLLKTLDFDVIALSPKADMAMGYITDSKSYALWDILNNKAMQEFTNLDFFRYPQFTSDGEKLFGLAGAEINPTAPKKARAISIYDINKKEKSRYELKDDLFKSSINVNVNYLSNDCRYAIFSLNTPPSDSSKTVYDLRAEKTIYQISMGTNAGNLSPAANFCISGDDLKTKLSPIFEITSSFRASSTFNFYAISPDNKFYVMPDFSQRKGAVQISFIEDFLICDMESKQVKSRINTMNALKGNKEGGAINSINLETVKISPDSLKAIIAVNFNAAGAYVAGSRVGFRNYLFSMENGNLIEPILPPSAPTLCFSPDGGNTMTIHGQTYLGTSDADKTQHLSFVDSINEKEYYSIKGIPKGASGIVRAITYSPDKSLVAVSQSASQQKARLLIYDIKKDKLISTFGEMQKPILFLEFSKDAKRLIGLTPKQTFSSIGGNRNPNNYYGYILTIYDLEINEELLSIEHDFGFPIMSMDISPDGHQIRFGGDKAEIWTAADWTK